MTEQTRWGFGEAPERPDASPRLTIDSTWTPRQLSAQLIRVNARRLTAASSLIIMHHVALMLIPVAVGGFIDEVVTPAASGQGPSERSGTFAFWVSALVVLYIAINIGFRFGSRTGWLGVQRGQYELSQAVVKRVLDPRGFEGHRAPPGQLLSIATADTQRACLVLYIMVYPPGEATALVIAAISLSVINPWLGLGAIIGLPIMMFLLHQLAKPLRQRSLREQSGLADAAGNAADLISGFRILRGLHAQHTAAGKYRSLSRTALDATVSARSAQARFEGVSTAGAQLFAAALALAGIALALRGIITPGELVTVTSIAVIVVNPLDSLVSTLGSMWAISQASAQRVLNLLATPYNPSAAGTSSPPAEPGALTFSQVNLNGTMLDTAIQPGEFVVVELPQSAAKALEDCLTVQGRAVDGQVTLANMALTDIDPHALRREVLVLPHRPGIFTGTVGHNVSADSAVAATALTVAAVDERELPLGLDTDVSDGAAELSGGQRQRVALARGVAADPPVLVLLEPTTSVDAVTEALITQRLYAQRQRLGATTIVVTSAPAFKAVADRIITGTPVGLPSEEKS